jgi:hypothetical protein
VLPSVEGVSAPLDLDPPVVTPRHPARLSPTGPRRHLFSARQSVVLACFATLSVHLLSLSSRLGPDEGGFAIVARHWLDGGPYLYGHVWVDRPPGLIAVFDIAQRLGPDGVRLTATAFAVCLVVAIASAAAALDGPEAAAWAAWVGFALGSATLLQADQLNGELVAATFVATSVAALGRCVREARGHRRGSATLGVVAGACAATAALMKQDIVDAFVFAGVLLLVGIATRTNRPAYRAAARIAVPSFAVGAAVPVLITVAWSFAHGGPRALAYALIGFRADASTVMASWSWAAPLRRLDELVVLAAVTGALLLLVNLVVSHRHRLRDLDPVSWAIAATVAVELVGVLAGANYWPHYLLAFVPMLGLAAGLGASRRMPGWRWTRRFVVLAAASTALVSPMAAIGAQHANHRAYSTGTWVAASAHPHDTLVVPYTHPNVIEAAGLEPGYPYLWSLPSRTLDPRLTLLTSRLNGAAAPTWVVRWDGLHTWGLDPGHHVDAALRAHYRPVAVVCGHTIWLHDGVDRQLAPQPSCGRHPS